MKKVLLITSAFVLALGLCGCEEKKEEPKTPDINSETIAVEMLVYMVEDGKYLRKDIQNGIVYEFVFENDEYKNTKVERTFVSSKRAEEFYNGNAGDRVVVKGAYHVRLASASNALPAHSHEH